MKNARTYQAKPGEVARNWVVIDLEGVVLGRAATKIANILRGKTKPCYTPHVDCGDFVIALNAQKVKLTGNKETDKHYYWHSGYPGGLKSRTAAQERAEKPEDMIRLAVKGMLGRSVLGSHQLKKLKVYAGSEHPHGAQNPQTVKVN